MSADDVIEIIEALPEYLKLIYPGYITIYIYYFCRAITIKDNKTIILKSIVLSYIYSILINEIVLPLDIFNKISNKQLIENILLTLLALIVAYISYRLTKSKRILNIFEGMKIHTTFSTNEIEEMENQSKDGTWVVAYMNGDNLVYEGYLINKEMEPDKRQYIALTQYRKFKTDKDGKPQEPYIEDFSDSCNEKVIIYMGNITHFEIRSTE